MGSNQQSRLPRQPLDLPAKRNRIILTVLLIVLITCIITLVISLYLHFNPPVKPSPPSKSPPEKALSVPAKQWGEKYCYAGNPKPLSSFTDQITIMTNLGYVVGYSESKEDPVWVCYRLIKVTSFQASPRPQGFQTDIRTRAKVNQRDYTGSGYDRGHMAPNYAIALCYGSQAQLETFLMSNIIPQAPNLNRRVWEHLEEQEIKDYAQRFKQLWVIVGPVFKGSLEKLKSGVEIPDACYKILVEDGDGRPRMLAFIMPQSVTGNEMPEQFLTSVDEVERETGLDFFSELPDDIENKIEAETAKRMW
jgi:endonuclease G